jgi:hypothetical protein
MKAVGGVKGGQIGGEVRVAVYQAEKASLLVVLVLSRSTTAQLPLLVLLGAAERFLELHCCYVCAVHVSLRDLHDVHQLGGQVRAACMMHACCGAEFAACSS